MSLLDFSPRIPPGTFSILLTKSASTVTERPKSPVNRSNVKDNKKAPITVQNKPNTLATENKFLSLSSDVDEDMDDSPSSPRPSRSRSRSLRRNGKISPVKYK